MASFQDPSLEDLTQFALDLVQNSGQEALKYYGKGKSKVKFDESLVTEAELWLKDYFQGQLDGRFPDHQVFSNNHLDEKYSHEEKRYLWIYDPIDGVDNFQVGIPIW